MSKIGFKLPLTITILLLSGLLVILAGGYYAYRNLNEVITLLSENNVPKTSLKTLKDLTISIEEAENRVRQYVAVKSQYSFERYQARLKSIDSALNILYTQYPDEVLFRSGIDTIDQLIDEKKNLWEELIKTWKENPSDTKISDISSQIKATDTIQSEKRGFLRRLFSQEKEKDTLTNSKILESLSNLEDEEKRFETRILILEARLASTSNLLSQAILSLIIQLEDYELSLQTKQQENASLLASEAYKMLTIFSLSGILLGIFVIILVISYTRKNQKYNEVLINSRRDAENLARSKELFMANVSHEIRTPLNAISGYIKQLMTMPFQKELNDKLKVVDDASDQLIRLINDVLDFTRLESGELKLINTHFDPGKIVHTASALFTELAARNTDTIKININNPGNIILFGDKNRFQQVLYNLLSNAVKFTENGLIEVNLDVSKISNNENKVVIEVSDTGIGIEKDKLKIIFNEFSQADETVSERYGGTGLGLSIVKRIVSLMNGEVSVKSEKGSGTIVTCIMTFQTGIKEELLKDKKEIAEPKLPENLTVLIADDERYNRSLLEMIMKKWKVNYDIAKNGIGVLEKIKYNNYDVILMDIRMPFLDGKMAAKSIRKSSESGKAVPGIIGLTADSRDKSLVDPENLFDAILIKPFTEEELYQVVKEETVQDKISGNKTEIKDLREESVADISGLARVAGNDINFMHEMIRQFEVTTIKGLDDIIASCEDENYQKVEDLAHMIIPASRHLGVKKLVSLLNNIEHYAEAKDKKAILDLVSDAKKETEIALVILESQYRKLNEK